MGEKDIAEKTLEAHNDVFSDIVNVLLFGGREVVGEDDLVDATPLSHYKADDRRVHGQERDVAKFWRNGSIRICLYGLENQTDIDADIPLRVISYDGAAYRAQLLSDKDATPAEPDAPDDAGGLAKKPARKGRAARFPVVTLVLYFGEKRWNRPRSLRECLDVPPELEPFVSDYRVNVFEVAYLEPEVVRQFRSDFRIVADYFVQVRRNKEYVPSQETIRHVHEVLQLMSVLTRDNRFEQAQVPPAKAEGGVTMCEVLDKVERRGINTGMQEGMLLGRKEGMTLGMQKGMLLGRKEGMAMGQNAILSLNARLLADGRVEDLRRASSDGEYLRQLLDELGLQTAVEDL